MGIVTVVFMFIQQSGAGQLVVLVTSAFMDNSARVERHAAKHIHCVAATASAR